MILRPLLLLSFVVTAAAFVLTGCGDPAGPDATAAFSAVSEVESFYVAYMSPDPIDKKDTVQVSFEYRNVKKIEVTATLDSGATWFTVATPDLQGSGSTSVRWIPFDDASHFSYFGRRQCLVKIADPVSSVEVFTDSFYVVGNVPFELSSPEGNEEYKITDSIHVYYSQNQDLTARLSALVFPDADDDSTSVSLSQGNQLDGTWEFVRYFHTAFRLDDPIFGYNQTSMPKIRVMVADYGTQVVQKSSGPITILP